MVTSIINSNITVYYGSSHTYISGYKTDGEERYNAGSSDSDYGEYRDGILYLKYNNDKISPNEGFTITAGTKLEIHFSYPIQNFASFFDIDYDSSEITSVDLSHFDSSKVINFAYSFNFCDKLKVLDMSNINLTNIKNFDFMFCYVDNLEYLNIRGIINPSEEFVILFSDMNLKVCQNTTIIEGNNIINDCCFFYEDDISCNQNYIIVYYGNDHKYNNGYEKGDTDDKYREGIKYLKYDNAKINPNENFTITAGSKLEIHFSYPIQNFSSFFDHDYDDSDIISIDLTNVDASPIISTKNMFHDCKSLTSINISNFNTLALKDISNMFSGCKSLEFLNLSSFNFSSLEYFSNLFEGCSNLKVLDVSGLNFDKNNSTSIFSGLSSLEYINIQNTQFNNDTENDLLTSIINNDYINICRDDDANVLENDNFIYVCCDYSIAERKCEGTSNYIKVYFGGNSSYEDGFKNKFREGITFVKYLNHFYKEDQKLNIKENEEIIIYLSTDLESLTNFFNVDNDPNVINIQKIECSSLDTSSITDMSSMFKGLDSLILLDLGNFNMEKVSKADNMFNEFGNLKYVNLYEAKNTSNYIAESVLNNMDSLTICQKDNIITNQNAHYDCCYFDIIEKTCKENFIKVYYGKDVEYKDGFQNEGRIDIDFLFDPSNNLKLQLNQAFIVKEGNPLLIFLSQSAKSLSNLFNGFYDSNAEYIISIDFSLYNTSLINDMSSLFYNCYSLTSINLGDFNITSVTNMSYMFSGCYLLEDINLKDPDTSKVIDMEHMFSRCTQLKFLDLSFFDTSLVTNMNNIFEKCTSLQFLNISYFNMEKVQSAENMFLKMKNLLFINLYNVKETKEYINKSLLNELNNLTVCQKESLITNPNATYNCCIYNYEIDECENMLTTIITYLNEESTLIEPRSTVNTIFTQENEIFSSGLNTELMSTFFNQDIENQDTNIIKESSENIIKSSDISLETKYHIEMGSTINKEQTSLTSETRLIFDSTLLEDKKESTNNYFPDTTFASEIRAKISNIDTTQINIPTTNGLSETTSINKESNSIIFKTYTQSQSSESLTPSENDFSTNDIITSNPDIIESTSSKSRYY